MPQMKIKSWTDSIKYIDILNVVAHTVQNIDFYQKLQGT
jgi:hypothetical protein